MLTLCAWESVLVTRNDDVAGRRHDVLGRQLERTEIELDHRHLAAAFGAGGLLRGADTPDCEEAEEEGRDGDRHRGPVQE